MTQTLRAGLKKIVLIDSKTFDKKLFENMSRGQYSAQEKARIVKVSSNRVKFMQPFVASGENLNGENLLK